jgi:hypothetical protein
MPGLKGHHFEILENVSYQVNIPVFENQSYACFNNETRKNDTCWHEVQADYAQETRYRYEYRPFSFWGAKLGGGEDYQIKLVGEKYAVLGKNDVKWIPTMMGIRIEEWDWWNSSWGACRNITIDRGKIDSDLTDFPVLLKLNGSRIDYSGGSYPRFKYPPLPTI